MSSLSSTSTLADVKAAYANNASYEEDKSPAKARVFITACRMLLQYPISVTSTTQAGTEQMTYDIRVIQAQMDAARIWLESFEQSVGGFNSRVKVLSFNNFR
ncbi:MAG TPA: hypothetical protein PKW18_13890 [Candidatus Sumerlaeota bacterium]|nr:MAG: hypothetical protein BWY90_00051 [Deltaproteobacteria bacterium ADurb.BinA014]HOE64657.1 hypothetical protein [Candidatus Sumerlaeota bacterium]HRR31979.1 hypothetical protein [Candidatus Sumerlaeia bacterium]HOR65946.1 hypothetical protein [Candidatus Sumerlaeota bacterium]HPL75646.1 hypothetical protein [Candidatus Sumerlaeota bacterium]